MWVIGSIIDFIILTIIPTFVPAWFIKKRWLATIACFGLSLVMGFAVSFGFHLLGETKEAKDMIKATFTQTWVLNVLLMNMVFHIKRKRKK